MGRRRKWAIIVFSVLLICGRQTMMMSAYDRQVGRNSAMDSSLDRKPAGEIQENTGKLEETGQIEQPGEEEESGDSAKPEEPKEPEEPLQMFELQYAQPDGDNGYYVNSPEVIIRHKSARGVTKYTVSYEGETVAEGQLSVQNTEYKITSGQLREGTCELHVWMEDEDNLKAEGYEASEVFRIDTAAPGLDIAAPQGFDAWYQNELTVSVSGQDSEPGSGISQIQCFIKGQSAGTLEGSRGEFCIREAAAGGGPVPVTFEVTDHAGNKGTNSAAVYIDNRPPETVIEGVQNHMITSRPLEVVFRAEDDNGLSSASARIQYEDEEGREGTLPEREWINQESGRSMTQILESDGIYHMKLGAKDLAGSESSQSIQVIIDKKNPVIHYVDELRDRHLKEFQWDYPVSELIQDFTSYTYDIRLDGKLYQMGNQVTREGNHVLKIDTADAAGNTASAQAAFVIDRTAPGILFEGVADQGVYEEECTCKIHLSEDEDSVEEIKINGQRQKLNSTSKMFQYTFCEQKEYELMATAKDLAGNQTTSYITFRVGPKESMISKILRPVKERLGITGNSPEEIPKTVKRKKNRLIIWPLIVLALSGATTAAGIVIYKKGGTR